MIPAPASLAVLGPGHSTQNRWTNGIDFSAIKDDVQFSDLPAQLQTHLREINRFVKDERKADTELKALYAKMLRADTEKGFTALRAKMVAIAEGADSLGTAEHESLCQATSCQHLAARITLSQSRFSAFRKNHWDRIHAVAPDFWTHSQNSHEEASHFFGETVKSLQQRLAEINAEIGKLEVAVTGSMRPPSDPAESVVVAMQGELTSFLNLAAKVGKLHGLVQQHRERFARQYGDLEAEEIFGIQRPAAIQFAESNGQQSRLRRQMTYDPQLASSQQAAGTAATAPAPATTASAFGLPPTTAPAAPAAVAPAFGNAPAATSAFGGFGAASPSPAPGAASPALATPAPAGGANAFAGGSPSPIVPSTNDRQRLKSGRSS
jgi:hypothetical protein